MALLIPNFSNMLFDDDFPTRTIKPSCRYHGHCSPFRQPRYRSVRRFNPLAPFNLFNDDNLKVKDTKDGFEAVVDLQGFEAKDLKIDVDPTTKVMTVECKREEKNDSGFVMSKNMTRSVRLPDHCKLDTIKSFMSANGKLKISCDKLAVEEEKKEAIENDNTKEDEVMEVEVEVHQESKKDDKSDEVEVQIENDEKDTDTHHEHSEVMEVPISTESEQEVSSNSNEVTEQTLEIFHRKLNMSGFDPQDIQVSVAEDGLVTITGKHHEELEDGGYSTREVTRKVLVDPSKYNLDRIESNFGKDEQLAISAPIKRTVTTNIPINVKA